MYKYSYKCPVSGNRKQHSVEELTEKLLTLVRSALNQETTTTSVPLLVGKQIEHEFKEVDGSGEKWWKGKVVSQVYIERHAI